MIANCATNPAGEILPVIFTTAVTFTSVPLIACVMFTVKGDVTAARFVKIACVNVAGWSLYTLPSTIPLGE